MTRRTTASRPSQPLGGLALTKISVGDDGSYWRASGHSESGDDPERIHLFAGLFEEDTGTGDKEFEKP
jgi:hypothetical protein